MERYVARLNIAHFEELLSKETDPAEIRILQSMLREERAKLAAVEASSPAAPKVKSGPDPDRATC